MMGLPTTYKAAKMNGYLPEHRLVELAGRAPRPGERPVKIKQRRFYHRSQLEKCISITEESHAR